MIVWTVMGDERREVCNLFGVQAVVAKWRGAGALQAELENCCRRMRIDVDGDKHLYCCYAVH